MAIGICRCPRPVPFTKPSGYTECQECGGTILPKPKRKERP